jgi:hypothetical protein
VAAHLFLVANAAGFGEISVGLRLAHDLSRRGERVVFLAPRDARVVLEKEPFAFEPIDDAYWDLERRTRALVRAHGCASLVLVDVTSVLLALHTLCLETDWLERFDMPVVALDYWDLRRAGPAWDLGSETWPLPPEARRLGRRLVPAPLARPDAPGAFDALPPSSGADPAAEREALGIPADGKLVLFTSSRFQLPELQMRTAGKRLAQKLPTWTAQLLDRLGAGVHVAHVGPAPFAAWRRWGERYRWLGQLPAQKLQAVLGAADLMLSFNTPGATTMAAVAAGVPALAAMNSRFIRSVEEAAAVLGRDPSDDLRRWLAEVVPLHPFHVWGLGLYHFAEPVLRDNPYLAAFRQVEVLDEDVFVDACRGLLYEETERDRLRSRQEEYRETVRSRLPSAADVFTDALRP